MNESWDRYYDFFKVLYYDTNGEWQTKHFGTYREALAHYDSITHKTTVSLAGCRHEHCLHTKQEGG